MKLDFVVLGATGLQGKIASRDLLEKGYSVLLCGRNKKRVDFLLKKYSRAKFSYIDASNTSLLTKIIRASKTKIVLNCVEGDWNLNILNACIDAKVNCLDLGSEIPMTKDQLSKDEILKKLKLTHITGCGSVPGIGNVMLAYAVPFFDSLQEISVGFAWNSNIKKFVVPFSIESIIEEFTEPATNIINGKFVKSVPLNSLKDYKDSFVGEQKSLYVRHPETWTFYHYFKNKGLKNVKFRAEFPAHSFNVIHNLIELGFGSKKEILVNGASIKPVEVLTEVLKELPNPKGYIEEEDLWVRLEGKKEKKNKIAIMQCKVPTIAGWESAGCNIDTGLSISIMAQMLHNGAFSLFGAFAPEAIIPPLPFFKELSKRKMIVYYNKKRIN